MRVTFCGTRGSTPAPGLDYVRFGGHTSCVALARDDGASAGRPTLLLDAGTGLRRLSKLLGDLPFCGSLLLTHLHWDHVQGLPFFPAGDREDARVRMLVPDQGDGLEAEALLARMMSPPFFPIPPSALRGEWQFAYIPAEPFTVEGFSVLAVDVPHKGGHTVGFRISDGHSSVAYIPDHCPTAFGPGPGGIGEYHEAALRLAHDVDLLIHDAHLRAEEVEAEGSFGHAAAEYAVRLGTMAGAGRVALFHHRPERNDAEVQRTVCRFAESPVPVIGAAESLTVRL
ncbi:MAG: MBL fold metallo-hydrolase [Acidimicrobiales bacterium]